MHWEKLDGVEYTLWATCADKDGVFEELSKKGILEEMEKLFFFKETRLLKKSKGDGEKKKEFLDTGVVKAFQIALSKYAQIPTMQVVTKILSCDKDMLDNSAIMDFLQREELCTISDNLMKNLAPYAVDWTEPGADGKKREADPNELRREDLIYLETAYNLHHYWKSRVRALTLTRTLDTDYSDLQTKIHQVVRVSDTVRSCKAFQDVLGLILSMGNYMNDTTKQVTGFKLGTLNRLVNVKDDKNQRTFMDYIEMTVRKKFPELEGFIDELHECVTLEKVDVDHLAQQAQKFIGNIHSIQMSVDSGNLSEPKKFHPQDRVLQVVLPILPEARKKSEYLKDYMEAMNKAYADLLTFYGEDPNDENSRKRFFKLISDFVKNYKASNQKNMELEDEERRREKRAQMAAQAQAKQAARDPLSPAAVAQSTGAMDALLDKLRAAGPSSRDKRDARRRARLRQNGAVRAASITKQPEIDGADGENTESETAAPAADAAPATLDDAEQPPMSPDITVTSADQPAEQDSLSKRTEEMLMRLRGDGAEGAAAASKGSMRDNKRKERRRRNGSNVSMSSTGSGSISLSLTTSPPVPPIPTNIVGSPGLMTAFGSAEGEDAVARAKSALMAMRRGSDTGSVGSGTSEQPTGTSESEQPTLGALSAPAIVDDDSDQRPATPTTIISPPSPDPEGGSQP